MTPLVEVEPLPDIRPAESPVAETTGRMVGSVTRVVIAARDYIRSHGRREIEDDARRLVRKYAVPSLIAAAVAGFLAGRALRGSG